MKKAAFLLIVSLLLSSTGCRHIAGPVSSADSSPSEQPSSEPAVVTSEIIENEIEYFSAPESFCPTDSIVYPSDYKPFLGLPDPEAWNNVTEDQLNQSLKKFQKHIKTLNADRMTKLEIQWITPGMPVTYTTTNRKLIRQWISWIKDADWSVEKCREPFTSYFFYYYDNADKQYFIMRGPVPEFYFDDMSIVFMKDYDENEFRGLLDQMESKQ